MAARKVNPQDALDMAAITFEWGDSYDAKVDYIVVTGQKWDLMPAKEFVAMVSDQGFLGDPLVDTQHFIGASKYQLLSENLAEGTHQLRAAHQRYTGPDKKTVEAKGHAHAVVRHTYKKIQGEWKLA
ncbi:scytalone dehydratase [Fusarium albosuccineum]|uniref:Scytalone dehydratase n=1 Tax=Fusarium albosuccineum TaxID=1237068 RepID=A0A8H4L9L0_9HYPO|nr:scytalone dehydratase [Fusarium albosuccineum]